MEVPWGAHAINARRDAGAAFVPEERLGHGAVPVLATSRKMVLTRHAVDRAVGKVRPVAGGAEPVRANALSRPYDVRKGKADPEARALSGGNLAEICHRPRTRSQTRHSCGQPAHLGC